MKIPKNFWSGVVGIALLTLLALGLVAVLKTFVQGGPGAQRLPIPQESPTQTPIPTEPGNLTLTPLEPIYPLPIQSEQVYPPPMPTYEVPPTLTPGAPEAPPTLTPWPTHTPYPSPTLPPGPAATHVPLVTPAKDAAGTIKYLVGAEKAKEALYALPVDAQGRPEKGASKLSEESDLSWANAFPSPDGSRIALFGDWCAETILYANSGRTEPMFKDTIGACGRFFDWHPDSRHLLMSADENYIDLGLWLVDTDTWEHTALAVPPNGSIQGGAISPDGQKVIYIWDRGFSNPSEVWMVNTDGQENHLLFTVDNSASDLTWSPDGSQVLLFGREVMVMGADGNSLHSLDLQFEPGCSRRETLPVWSPDSRFLAYTASRSELVYTDPWNPDAFQETQVCLMDLGSGKVQPLLPGESSGLMDPTWSPDGAQIAFVSNRSGTSEIWAVDVDGSNLHQLTQAGQAVRFPYWRRP